MITGIYTLILLALIIYACNSMKFSHMHIYREGGGNLSLSDTSILKGIAILLVVVGHIGQVIPNLRVFTPLGATGVGVFLLCSGYGIEKSVVKNGLKKYWYKRLMNVWLPYAFLELLTLPLHWECGLFAILKDLALLQPLHPFGWYMRFLFLWYIIYYTSSNVGKYKQWLLLIVSILVWIFFDSLHAQNAFSFVFGVMMAQSRIAETIWKAKYVLIGLITSVLFFFIRDFTKHNYHEIDLLWKGVSLIYYVALTLTVVIGYKLLSISNIKLPYKGLAIIGLYSYEIYLIHGYAFYLLRIPASAFMVTEFVLVSILGSFLFHRISHSTINYFNNQMNK